MIGFYRGGKQQTVPVVFEISIPPAPGFERINIFIKQVLGDQHTEGAFAACDAIPDTDVPTRYASTVLYLASGLQRLGLAPIFANGQLVELRQDAIRQGIYHAKSFLPRLDFFPLALVEDALAVAAHLILWSSENTEDHSDLNWAYKLITEKIIRPIQQIGHSGVSTLPILKAAFDQDIPFWHLGHGTYLLGMGSNSHVISRSAVDADSAIGSEIANRKDRTAQLLKIAGLPVPSHIQVSTLDQALQAADAVGWPVVVKPTDRERSEGVTTGINNEDALETAISNARKFSKNILIEHHVPGTCFRLMVANRKFLYAVERRPRSVMGNATHSIRELLQAEQVTNGKLPPWARKKPLILDEAMVAVIRSQGFEPESVPGAGVRVSLRSVESTEWGETTLDVTTIVAPENVAIVERAAAALGLSNAGVDMISTDISRPWSEVGAVINEVNFRPHFGGTAAAKARMQSYVKQLVSENGRLPVEVYVGDQEAVISGRNRQSNLIMSGVRACLTTHQITYGSNGAIRQFAGEDSLMTRCQALVIDKDVDAIILVIQNDEFLYGGLPVNSISTLNLVNHHLNAAQNANLRLPKENVERIVELLATFLG